VESSEGSMRGTKSINLQPYAVDEAFQGLSYSRRYEEVCRRLVRDRLYDAACFFTSESASGIRGRYREPAPELSIRNFAKALHARASVFARLRK
jgi:hypothetical protein